MCVAKLFSGSVEKLKSVSPSKCTHFSSPFFFYLREMSLYVIIRVPSLNNSFAPFDAASFKYWFLHFQLFVLPEELCILAKKKKSVWHILERLECLRQNSALVVLKVPANCPLNFSTELVRCVLPFGAIGSGALLLLVGAGFELQMCVLNTIVIGMGFALLVSLHATLNCYSGGASEQIATVDGC